MQNHIYVSSKGVMPVEAFSMMGVSTKRNDDNTIGMFGTGLKYGIAKLVDMGINFSIITGGREIIFGTKKINVKGQEFKQIVYRFSDQKKMRELGFSAEMGLQWTLKDALREIIANALDEGDFLISPGEPEREGRTIFMIELKPEVKEYFDDIERYFILSRQPIHETEHCRIYPKINDSAHVYMKKVMVYNNDTYASLYDYDFDKVNIDETRRAHPDGFRSIMTEAILAMPEHIIENFVNSFDKGQFIEHRCSSYCWTSEETTDRWNKVIGDAVIVTDNTPDYICKKLVGKKILHAPISWEQLFRQNNIGISPRDALKESDIENLEEYIPSEYELLLFNSAKKFLTIAGYDLTDLKFFFYQGGDGTLGKVLDGNIWISSQAFRNGKKDMVDTILHEMMHILSGEEDESRMFESYIISELVKQLELKTGEIL